MDLDLGRRSIVEWAEAAPEAEAAVEFAPAQEKFRVEAPIGKGGMGEVFLVSDQDLRRQVAMKVLRRDQAQGREQRLHFVAEAQATSQLEHPGIPPVHDIGLTKEGRLYFTMKLVQGRTLREVLARSRRSSARRSRASTTCTSSRACWSACARRCTFPMRRASFTATSNPKT